jgi:hypothetical protein
MEPDAAPAGVLRKHALGRRRGSARRPIRAARQELADGGHPGSPEAPSVRLPQGQTWRGRRQDWTDHRKARPGAVRKTPAMARREAPAFSRGSAAQKEQWLRHLARRPLYL